MAKVSGQLEVRWLDVANAQSYSLFSDLRKDGSYATLAGTARAGRMVIVRPVPAEPVVFLRIAAENCCGEGSN